MTHFDSAVVIGCNGHFGRIFVGKLREAGIAAVHGIDLQSVPCAELPGGRYVRARASDLGPEALELIACAHVVMPCIPETAVIDAMPTLDRTMAADGLVVDVASVKSRIAQAYARHVCRVGYLSLHPMFAPIEDFGGRALALVELRGNERSAAFERLVATWGAEVTKLGVDDHDRAMAAVQVLPHAALLAFGEALIGIGVPFDTVWRLATPIQKTMLGLLFRVTGRDQLTHYSIQAENPHAASARDALDKAVQRLMAVLAQSSERDFVELLDRSAAFIAPADADVQQIAQRIVDASRS